MVWACCRDFDLENIPERAIGVKGLLADFLCVRSTSKRLGLCVRCPDAISVLERGSHGHVYRGCSRRSFHRGGTPIHSFVNVPAWRQSFGSRGIRHRVFCCDRLADEGRLIQSDAPRTRWSPCSQSDWPCVCEGLFFRGRRADATVPPVFRFLPGLPRAPFRLRRRLGPPPLAQPLGGRARAKARRGGPLLSSPSRGLVLRRLLRQFFLGWASNHVALLVLYHVPDDRRQPAHHRHPGNLRAAAALDPAVPGPHPAVAPQDVQHHLRRE